LTLSRRVAFACVEEFETDATFDVDLGRVDIPTAETASAARASLDAPGPPDLLARPTPSMRPVVGCRVGRGVRVVRRLFVVGFAVARFGLVVSPGPAGRRWWAGSAGCPGTGSVRRTV
jgi:hypothetical protein